MLSAPDFARVNVCRFRAGGDRPGRRSGQHRAAIAARTGGDKDVALAGPVPDIYGAGVDFSAGIAWSAQISVKAQAFPASLPIPRRRRYGANGVEFIGSH